MLKTKSVWTGIGTLAFLAPLLWPYAVTDTKTSFVPSEAEVAVSIAISSLKKVADDRYELVLTTTNSSNFPVCLGKRVAEAEVYSFPYRASDGASGEGETFSVFDNNIRLEHFKLFPKDELTQVIWFAPSEMVDLSKDGKYVERSRGIDGYNMQPQIYIFDCKFNNYSDALRRNSSVVLQANRSYIVRF